MLSEARYLEIRALRVELEGLGAAMAARHIDGATLAQLEQLLLANQEAIARQDLAGALQCNQAFHLGLAQASGMPTLKRFVDHLWMQIAPLIAAGYAAFTPTMRVGHHRAILDALHARDGEAARQAMARDILDGGAQLLAYVRQMEQAGTASEDEKEQDD